jgi:hypothetical protein
MRIFCLLEPGLMDAHSHITFEMSEDWKQDELDGFKKTIAVRP